MNLKTWIKGFSGLMLAILVTATALADSGDPLGEAKIIGIIPLTKAGATQNILRHVDKMVPELKKISSERVIKLECRYNGLPQNEKDVENAYTVAGKVEKYLREHHKLNLDLWVAADLSMHTRQKPPALTFSVFSNDIKNIEKLPVSPAQNSTE